ncbi:MAG: hypothetical protein ACTTKH_07475 [Treponema sp.]
MKELFEKLFENKMNIIVGLLVLGLFIFGLLLVVRLQAIKKAKAEMAKPVIVDSNMLYLLEEPLQLPPVQFSRKQRKQWQMNEIEWWVEPFSKEDVETLKLKNRAMIEKLLNNVP